LERTSRFDPETVVGNDHKMKVRYMDTRVLVSIFFASLATGCAYHQGVVAVLPAPVEIGSISGATMRSGTRVIINLSEQRAYLIEGGKVSLVSPIASGKPGWSTPTGSFSVISKDIDHRSQSFGLIIDGSGRIASSSATPGTHVPSGFHYQPAPMPYYMEFTAAIGMHAGYLPGYPASHGCVRMPRDLAERFFERVNIRTPVTVDGSTHNLTSVRKAIPLSY
jgi:lipoprotein-anchoring transpeptidase ErfK/SrfK